MGLDVYLEKCKNKKEADRLEAEYEQRSDEIWNRYGEYDSMTQAEKDAARVECDTLKEELGLAEWGKHPDKERVEIDSALYPEHYFKIGYFRSSYNNGGINSVFKRRGLPDLYDVFLPNDRYEFAPDWAVCLDHARALLEQCRAYNGKNLGRYDCMEVSATMFSSAAELAHDANNALLVFENQLGYNTGSRAYSCRDGTFYLDGVKCVGFVPGLNLWKQPCVYVIYEKENADEQDWYEQAIEIVIETIEYVMAQPDATNYYLIWSS